MIDIRPYAAGDEALIEIQPAQLVQPHHPIPNLVALGHAWTVRAYGRVVAICGFMMNHAAYVTAWGSFAPNKRMALVPIVRAIAVEICAAVAAFRRVDMMVVRDFAPGHRLALELGMTPEATLRAAGPGGEDMVIWTRVREAG